MRSIEVLKVTNGRGEISCYRRDETGFSEAIISEVMSTNPCPITFKYMTMTELEYAALRARIALANFSQKFAEMMGAA